MGISMFPETLSKKASKLEWRNLNVSPKGQSLSGLFLYVSKKNYFSELSEKLGKLIVAKQETTLQRPAMVTFRVQTEM